MQYSIKMFMSVEYIHLSTGIIIDFWFVFPPNTNYLIKICYQLCIIISNRLSTLVTQDVCSLLDSQNSLTDNMVFGANMTSHNLYEWRP